MSLKTISQLNNQESLALNSARELCISPATLSKAYVVLSAAAMQHLEKAQHQFDLMKILTDIFSSPPHVAVDEKSKLELKAEFEKLISEMTVSQDEKNSLNLIIHNRLTYTEQERKKSLELLKRYLPQTIFRFSEASPTFKAFCQTNLELEKAWASILKQTNQLDETIKSYDGKVIITVYDQYVGTFVLNQLEESKQSQTDGELLKKGCELGLYQALNFRCEVNINKLTNQQVTPDDQKRIIEEILFDTKKLTAYWAIGYYRGGQTLLALADSFTILEEKEKAEKYYRDAVDHFCIAYLLENHPTSKKLIDIYNQGNAFAPEDENKEIMLAGTHISPDDYDIIRTQHSQALDTILGK